MPTFHQRDLDSTDFQMETVSGDAGGDIAKVALQAATATAIVNSASSLAAIASSVDGLEGSTDGIETLIASTNTKLDTIDGRVDGLETLVTSANTKLDTLHTDVTPNSSGPFVGRFTVGTGAAQVNGGTSQPLKHGVIVFNTHATQNLDIGLSGVTTGAGHLVRPGMSERFPCANLNQFYVVGSGAGTTGSYLAI